MEFIFAIGSAFWIGVLTSISPCPLATNIAAISFISKKGSHIRTTLLTGVLYTLGRVMAYIILSVVVIKSLYSIPALSSFLQTEMHKILGPLLIVVGMFLVELIGINLPRSERFHRLKMSLSTMGIWGAFPLGILFALSFCPVSAALFFGSLIPIASKFSSSLIVPAMYGVGSGLPVFVFAILLAIGSEWVSKLFDKIGKVEAIFRMGAGIIFILVGIYLSLAFIFKVI